MGAKVLHIRSVEFAKKYKVPVRVRSTFSNDPGTLVTQEDSTMEAVLVSGIAYDKDQARVTLRDLPDVPGTAASVFGPLSEKGILVDMIVQNTSQDGHTDMLQGFAEAYYDPERSRDESVGAPVPHTPLAVELHKANLIYDDAYANVKNFLESARGGAIDLTFARPLVGDIIKSLSRNVDALVTLSLLKKTDEYTYSHSVNVTIFAVAFANFLGMPEERLHNVGLAGLLHDYGKALIPNEILTAPRSLTLQEFETMPRALAIS